MLRKTTVLYSIVVLYGMWVDFYPSQKFYPWNLYLSFFLSVFIFIRFYSENKIKTFSGKSLIKRGIASLLAFVFLTCSSVFFIYACADIVTQLIGNQTSLVTLLSKEYSSASGGQCNYRLTGDILDRAFLKNYLCISKSSYLSFANRVTVQLDGKESFFGFHVKSVKPK